MIKLIRIDQENKHNNLVIFFLTLYLISKIIIYCYIRDKVIKEQVLGELAFF